MNNLGNRWLFTIPIHGTMITDGFYQSETAAAAEIVRRLDVPRLPKGTQAFKTATQGCGLGEKVKAALAAEALPALHPRIFSLAAMFTCSPW